MGSGGFCAACFQVFLDLWLDWTEEVGFRHTSQCYFARSLGRENILFRCEQLVRDTGVEGHVEDFPLAAVIVCASWGHRYDSKLAWSTVHDLVEIVTALVGKRCRWDYRANYVSVIVQIAESRFSYGKC